MEDMLLSMLDERDRLMVGLKEAREELQTVQLRLRDVEKERDNLQTQLSNVVPAVSLSSLYACIIYAIFTAQILCLYF